TTYERFADAGRWSRYTRKAVRGPRADNPDGFISWLRRRGPQRPGFVLIPTGDATAWLYSHHREELAAWYRVGAVPPLSALLHVIDKVRLVRAAAMAGLPTAATWAEEDGEPLEAFLCRAKTDRFWMKPRTQAGLLNFSKGTPVTGDVAAQLSAYGASLRFHPAVATDNPELLRPVLQVEQGTGRPLY